jgi:hypothetical protein
MKERDQSPWGSIQHLKKHGNSGIVSVSTAGHGGIYVPPDLVEKIPKEWREESAGWSGSQNWYEEDCNWSYVAVALHEHFKEHDRFFAISSVIGDDKSREVLQKHFPESVTWYYEFLKTNGHKVRLGGGGSGGGHWTQRAYSLDGTTAYTWQEDWKATTVEQRCAVPPIFHLDEYVHLMVPGTLTKEDLKKEAA